MTIFLDISTKESETRGLQKKGSSCYCSGISLVLAVMVVYKCIRKTEGNSSHSGGRLWIRFMKSTGKWQNKNSKGYEELTETFQRSTENMLKSGISTDFKIEKDMGTVENICTGVRAGKGHYDFLYAYYTVS